MSTPTYLSSEFTPPTPPASEPARHPVSGRQPHLGYALLLLAVGAIIFFLLLVAYAVWGRMAGVALPVHGAVPKGLPKLSIALEALTFAGTLGFAAVVFPRMWHHPFLETIRWNARSAGRNPAKLIPLGFALSFGAQMLESHLTLPKKMPIDEFFRSPTDVWFVAIFGTFIAPVVEEIFFRGFLLRGVAIAWDWFATPRTEAGRAQWQSTDRLSRPSLIFSGVVTSGMFAAMHAGQLNWAWNAVAILWIVGGVLTAVRLRLNSVAASSLVHAAYNGSIFIVLFFGTGGFQHLDRMTQR